MNIELLRVGQSRDEWKGLPDGYIMEYDSFGGLILYVHYCNPKPEEEVQIAGGSFKIRFWDYKGVGFFCVQFGNLPWGDCPFSPNLYKEKPEFEVLEPKRGYALNVIFIDTATGTIKALRLIGLGHDFSKQFRDWCEESLKKQMSRNWYEKTVSECYEEYEIMQIVKRAKIEYEYRSHEDRERG